MVSLDVCPAAERAAWEKASKSGFPVNVVEYSSSAVMLQANVSLRGIIAEGVLR